jgi:uncharacterized iron-regulated membrane protein
MAQLLAIVVSSGTVATVTHEIDDFFRGERPGACSWADVDARLAPTVTAVTLERGRLVESIETWNHQLGRRSRACFGEEPPQQGVVDAQVFFRQLHKGLLLPEGIVLVCLLGALLLVATGTGWFVERSMRRRIDAGSASVHRALGRWLWPFAALLAATGAYYVVPHVTELQPPKPRIEADSGESLPWSEVVARAEREHGKAVRTLVFPYEPDAPAVVVFAAPSRWMSHGSIVAVDPFTGTTLPTAEASLDRVSAFVDTVHAGTFLGLPSKLLWVVGGLALWVALATGPAIWASRQRRGEAGGAWVAIHLPGACVLLASTLALVLSSRSEPVAPREGSWTTLALTPGLAVNCLEGATSECHAEGPDVGTRWRSLELVLGDEVVPFERARGAFRAELPLNAVGLLRLEGAGGDVVERPFVRSPGEAPATLPRATHVAPLVIGYWVLMWLGWAAGVLWVKPRARARVRRPSQRQISLSSTGP